MIQELATAASLGVAGGGAQVALRVLSGVGSFISNLDGKRYEQEKEKQQIELNRWEAVAEATKNVRGQGGAWVYRMFAIACVVVLLSTILIPLFQDVTIQWYYPKIGYNLFVFQKEKMEIFTIGNGPRTIAILPFQVSFAANVTWFYLCGKPFKSKNR